MSATTDGDDAIGRHGEPPSPLGDGSVVPTAQRDEVVHHRPPTVSAGSDVVQVGPSHRGAAAGEPATLIAGVDGSSNTRWDDRRRSRHPEDPPGVGEQEAEIGVTGEPAHRLRSQARRCPDGGPEQPGITCHVVVACQRRDVGDHLDPRPRTTTCVPTTEEALSEPQQPVGPLSCTARSRDRTTTVSGMRRPVLCRDRGPFTHGVRGDVARAGRGRWHRGLEAGEDGRAGLRVELEVAGERAVERWLDVEEAVLDPAHAPLACEIGSAAVDHAAHLVDDPVRIRTAQPVPVPEGRIEPGVAVLVQHPRLGTDRANLGPTDRTVGEGSAQGRQPAKHGAHREQRATIPERQPGLEGQQRFEWQACPTRCDVLRFDPVSEPHGRRVAGVESRQQLDQRPELTAPRPGVERQSSNLAQRRCGGTDGGAKVAIGCLTVPPILGIIPRGADRSIVSSVPRGSVRRRPTSAGVVRASALPGQEHQVRARTSRATGATPSEDSTGGIGPDRRDARSHVRHAQFTGATGGGGGGGVRGGVHGVEHTFETAGCQACRRGLWTRRSARGEPSAARPATGDPPSAASPARGDPRSAASPATGDPAERRETPVSDRGGPRCSARGTVRA
jgi:hypothetical protein